MSRELSPRGARAARAALALALEVPALMLMFSGQSLAPIGGLMALLAIAGARFGRFDRPAALVQVAIQLGCLTAALVTLNLTVGSVQGNFGLYVTIGALSLALPQAWWRADRLGNGLALAAGLLAVMGLARAVSRPAFGVGVAAYLGIGVVATLLRDGGWPALLQHRRRVGLPLALTLGATFAILGGLGWALPAAEPVVSKALQPYLFGGPGASGFGEGRIELGDGGRITLDNSVMLRVEGQVDHLRGRVYVDYIRGSWAMRRPPQFTGPVITPGRALPLTPVDLHAPLPPAGEGPVRLEGTPDSGLALFAPLDAIRIDSGPPQTRLDAYGVAMLSPDMISEPRAWTLTPGDPAKRAVFAPTGFDLRLPRHWRAEFLQLGEEWTAGAATDREKLDAIQRRFARDFTYSLDLPRRQRGMDPTWAFLTEHKRGHCEYFASGLVLLARAVGIPARMVAGYRVVERNPAGGYHVVRARDAHAWAEVFLDGRWQTWEATPPGSLDEQSRQSMGWLAARWDVFKRGFGRVFERLADLTLVELAVALTVISALILIFIRVRRGNTRSVEQAESGWGALDDLEAHLGRQHQLVRAPHETLTRFAERVRDAASPAAAELIEACAQLRYGGQGDAAALAARIAHFVGERR